MNRKTIVALSLCAASLPFFAACDSISFSPGESQVIRVAAAQSTKSGSPTQGCMNDPNHTTTFRAGGTFMVYGVSTSGGDQFFLDTGTAVLQGSQGSDGSYSFSGKDVKTDMQGGGNFNVTITTTTTDTITLNLSGDSVDGKDVSEIKAACTSSSGNCPQDASSDCTTTSTFVGVAVDSAANVPPK